MSGGTDRAGASAVASEPRRGTSVLQDAWRRLRRNRAASASAVFILVVALCGYAAPLISAYLTHFSSDEIHSRLAYQPPGSADVSRDHPSYDGSKAAFQALDQDGDGYLSCWLEKLQRATLDGLPALRRMTRVRGADGKARDGLLYRQALADLDALDQRIPIKHILRVRLGTLHCPELDLPSVVARDHYDYLFDYYDVATGDEEPTDALRPDGYLTWKEFPKRDAELHDARLDGGESRFAGLGLTGRAAFEALDVDGNEVVEIWEVTERTRHLRYDKRDLIERFDADHDLRVSREEFPGAPELHTFWLGTDGKGRDVLTRLLYGARISITIGLLTTLVAFFIGVTYGSVAGYLGGRIDNVMMRVVDVMYGLPYIVVVILLIVVVGRSTLNLFIALGAVQWLTMARVVRGQVISLQTREFVEAARAIGVGRWGIIFRHLLPNTIGPVIVYSTLMVPAVILQEAFLSFLGLGVQPPDPSWGNMISEGADKLSDFPWLIAWPALVLAVTLFAMNFLGDGVRDALDPRVEERR